MLREQVIDAHIVGECPVCGSEELEYRHVQDTDGGVCYPWACNTCGATGEEVYELTFIAHENIRRGE